MAVYRKKLLDKDGNTIIPAVGDIYGQVYTATLSSATAGATSHYDFTPDTPLENNKVYAVKFPTPTVDNSTIILGDGTVSGSILVPPVTATDSPNYELLTTDMINSTEPLLLMYSGVQWVCLNQKKKVGTSDLEDSAVTSDKIDWATLPYKYVATLSVQSINSTNPTQLTNMSITIDTAGLYLIALNGNYQAYGTPGSYPRFGVYVGADRKFYSAVSTLPGLQNNFAAIGILNVNAGEVVRGMVTGGACQVFEGCRLVAVRIG